MVRESTVSLKGGRPEQCWGHGSSWGISHPWGGRTDLLEPTGNMGMLGSCCHHYTRPSSPAPTSLPREEQLCLGLYEWVAVSSFRQECVLFLHSCQSASLSGLCCLVRTSLLHLLWRSNSCFLQNCLQERPSGYRPWERHMWLFKGDFTPSSWSFSYEG